MDPSIVSDMIDNIYKHHSISKNVEISLEANPSSVEMKKFRDYASAGINRISIGVQSFIDKDLKLAEAVRKGIGALEVDSSIVGIELIGDTAGLNVAASVFGVRT